MGPVRVAVLGALGRMGATACGAVAGADDLALVAAIGRSRVGTRLRDALDLDTDVVLGDDLDVLVDAHVDVALDLTSAAAVADNVAGCVRRGVHVVVGTSGLDEDDVAGLDRHAREHGRAVLVVPNFAIGAVLLLRFAAEAARHLPHVEIVERHHDGKADAPSGTAMRTAELIRDARGVAPDAPDAETVPGARGGVHAGVRIHAVRLPGLVAHQEVVFGGQGQTLTLRHDSVDRSSFMPGVLTSLRHVADLAPGVHVGLDHVLAAGEGHPPGR